VGIHLSLLETPNRQSSSLFSHLEFSSGAPAVVANLLGKAIQRHDIRRRLAALADDRMGDWFFRFLRVRKCYIKLQLKQARIKANWGPMA
jgi:hypothetical protein